MKGGVRVTMYVGQTEAAIDAVVAFDTEGSGCIDSKEMQAPPQTWSA